MLGGWGKHFHNEIGDRELQRVGVNEGGLGLAKKDHIGLIVIARKTGHRFFHTHLAQLASDGVGIEKIVEALGSEQMPVERR
jgi:hypothetical protein